MASRDTQIKTTASVLDRLIDYEPDLSKEPPKSRSKTLSELKQAVRRDIEWLLNTKKGATKIPESLEETTNSMATYGLSDLTGLGISNPAEQQRLVKEVEKAIRTFEPRFIDLKVKLEPINNLERSMRFKIEANLDVEPAPEPIVFDTILELASGDFEVRER